MPANRPRHPNARLVKPAEVVLLPVQARKQGGHCVLIWLASHSLTGVGLSLVRRGAIWPQLMPYNTVPYHAVPRTRCNTVLLSQYRGSFNANIGLDAWMRPPAPAGGPRLVCPRLRRVGA